MVLEGVDALLPRGSYRVQATASSQGHVVSVEGIADKRSWEFPVRRDELATDARAEWVAISIARAVRAESAAQRVST